MICSFKCLLDLGSMHNSVLAFYGSIRLAYQESSSSKSVFLALRYNLTAVQIGWKCTFLNSRILSAYLDGVLFLWETSPCSPPIQPSLFCFNPIMLLLIECINRTPKIQATIFFIILLFHKQNKFWIEIILARGSKFQKVRQYKRQDKIKSDILKHELILISIRSIKRNKEMIDFGKIYCNLHPHELITNFCTKEECLAGLCANCVCTHTQIHIDKGTAPEYENIRTTYRKAQESIRYQVELFEKDKQRIGRINEKVIEKRQKVKQIMEVAKEEVSLLLGTYFQEKEKNMMREIEGQEKKYGLHCQNRLQSLNSYISREVSNLISAAQELSSNNFLQSLPRVRTQCLINSQKLHQEVQKQLHQNEKFSTTISCNKGLLHTLVQVLQRAITVNFNNQPLSSRLKTEPETLSRPKSQGRLPENTFLQQKNIMPSSFNGRQRNVQSQVQINFQGNPFPSNKNLGQARKSSYLNQIPSFMNQIKPSEPVKPKISANPNQNSINIAPSYNFNTNSFQSGYVTNQPVNLPLNMNSQAKIFNSSGGMQKMMPSIRISEQPVYKNMERPSSNGGNQQSMSYTPTISQMMQGRPLERSTASNLNKKSKKIGLKLLTTNDGQPNILQNVQNQRPWRQI